jgi:hypothetical protein
MLTEIGDVVPVEERTGRLREHDLATVPGGGDPRSEVDDVSHVALYGDKRCPRVETDAQVDGTCSEAFGHRQRRRHRSRRCGKGEEEGVALCVDLDSRFDRARLADDAAMLGERLRVRLRAE